MSNKEVAGSDGLLNRCDEIIISIVCGVAALVQEYSLGNHTFHVFQKLKVCDSSTNKVCISVFI